MSLLMPTRCVIMLLQLSLLFSCMFVPSIYCIPFSTVFRRTTSLWTRRPLTRHYYDESRIPPFLRKQSGGATTITETVYSLLGGFADSTSKWSRQSSSLSAATSVVKEETSAASVPPSSAPPAPSSKDSSVHLKLGSQAMLNPTEQKDEDNENDKLDKDKKEEPPLSLLHTYTDVVHNVSFTGLNVSKRKFSAWVNRTLQQEHHHHHVKFVSSLITTKQVNVQDMSVRQELRQLWRQRQLLTDRTEVLAIYKSELESNGGGDVATSNTSDQAPTSKRGGFSDLLHIYADRLSDIIQDEEEEYHISFKGATSINRTGMEGEVEISPEIQDILNGGLLGWLTREYGEKETKQLLYENLKRKSTAQQYQVFQHFLEWFRSRFPYYYDRCDSCGASAKDEPEIECIQDDGMDDTIDADGNETNTKNEQDEDDDDDNGSFLGYVYPSDQELLGKASRTEIYQCLKCGAFTRFPRYNAASSVIQHKRGRCGEYSMLLYRILRATGHTCRWIVDWADHVWAEVYLNDKWIHLDPCEAAVDKPLLYEEWGKQQTYIVAFHAPLANGLGSLDRRRRLGTNDMNASVPLIEDVTLRYTSSDKEEIQKRRDESDQEITEYVDSTTAELEQKLDRILNQ